MTSGGPRTDELEKMPVHQRICHMFFCQVLEWMAKAKQSESPRYPSFQPLWEQTVKDMKRKGFDL